MTGFTAICESVQMIEQNSQEYDNILKDTASTIRQWIQDTFAEIKINVDGSIIKSSQLPVRIKKQQISFKPKTICGSESITRKNKGIYTLNPSKNQPFDTFISSIKDVCVKNDAKAQYLKTHDDTSNILQKLVQCKQEVATSFNSKQINDLGSVIQPVGLTIIQEEDLVLQDIGINYIDSPSRKYSIPNKVSLTQKHVFSDMNETRNLDAVIDESRKFSRIADISTTRGCKHKVKLYTNATFITVIEWKWLSNAKITKNAKRPSLEHKIVNATTILDSNNSTEKVANRETFVFNTPRAKDRKTYTGTVAETTSLETSIICKKTPLGLANQKNIAPIKQHLSPFNVKPLKQHKKARNVSNTITPRITRSKLRLINENSSDLSLVTTSKTDGKNIKVYTKAIAKWKISGTRVPSTVSETQTTSCTANVLHTKKLGHKLNINATYTKVSILGVELAKAKARALKVAAAKAKHTKKKHCQFDDVSKPVIKVEKCSVSEKMQCIFDLHTDDSSEEEDQIFGDWCNGISIKSIKEQNLLPKNILESLFVYKPINLKEIFPDIDDQTVHRNSSAVWKSSPHGKFV